MNQEEVKSKLKAFFMSDLGVDGDVLKYDTPLFGEEIGLDSVDALEIISFAIFFQLLLDVQFCFITN